MPLGQLDVCRINAVVAGDHLRFSHVAQGNAMETNFSPLHSIMVQKDKLCTTATSTSRLGRGEK